MTSGSWALLLRAIFQAFAMLTRPLPAYS
jgi:hypothetical protein